MSTPVVFNWIIFGWIGYLIGYALFPLTLLCTKKFLETSDLRYALMNGLIFAAGTIQPTMIVIYPVFGLLFVVFESRGNFLILKRGIILSIISITIWVLLALSFFTSFNNAETLSYYYGEYIEAIKGQFVNLSSISNAIRLWGSTYNFQFETYFPKQLIIFSFLPIAIAMIGLIKRSLDRRVLFFALSFLFVFFSYFIYHNLTYLISSNPYGAIFEAPSIFLVPASLALAILIAYANQAAQFWSSKISKIISHASLTKVIFSILLISIVLSGYPWWAGEVSGNPISGPQTKLNLYQIPQAYTTWSNNLITNQQYFVLYLPLSTNVKIDDSIFSKDFEGVNQGIFTQVNDLPYVSISNASLFLDNLMSGIDGLGQKWGSYSIRYIVVYTNVLSDYNMSDILDRLSAQEGIVPVESLPDVKVFENKHALPVIYPIGNNVELNIIYQDPVSFKVEVNSSVPFILVLNQVYSSGWKVWVNGSIIPAAAQYKANDGFNGWCINEIGHLIVDIYYEPQTTYLISKIIATTVLVIVSFYIITRTICNLVRRNKSGRADGDNSVKPFFR